MILRLLHDRIVAQRLEEGQGSGPSVSSLAAAERTLWVSASAARETASRTKASRHFRDQKGSGPSPAD